MDAIPTIKLYKGDKELTCNAADEERLAADGWGREMAPLSEPEPEPEPEAVPELESGVYEDPNPTMLDPVGEAKAKPKRTKK